jgi:hypothetical protein
VTGTGLADERGFTVAYLACAAVAAVAALIAVVIPRGAHQAIRARAPRPALAER